jgi:phosphoribosylformylglycinamidine (FGAM) synthase-like enzyme
VNQETTRSSQYTVWCLSRALPHETLSLFQTDSARPQAFDVLSFRDLSPEHLRDLERLFPQATPLESLSVKGTLLARQHHDALVHPMEQSLSSFLKCPTNTLRLESWIVFDSVAEAARLKPALEILWREPAIEQIWMGSLQDWKSQRLIPRRTERDTDPSFEAVEDPSSIGLEFSAAELAAIRKEESRLERRLNRTEWELVAQTWSEHCKHKIFAAEIASRDARSPKTKGLFKTHLRAPALQIQELRPSTYLSLFHDNSGVLGLSTSAGGTSPWAFCIKMETHNSPSAISPYGGASTGLVGVHRDILGTGLGAKPFASWDVLCFEDPDADPARPRPTKALAPDVIRRGVLKGIEDGGNQSGIPTVQGSVVFDASYAAKPLVFAGTLGVLGREHVDKKALKGDVLFCVGGAVGPDGLRGAVMSSRDLRADDFSGSAVQVAQPFVQRCLTEFLIEARDRGLISTVTDNGAGGLASSVGEMAQSSGGATIDVSQLRTKFEGLYGWERLLSESQERMTVGTRDPEAFCRLAKEWGVEWDELGKLTDTGRFEVTLGDRALVSLSLEFLHNACPLMELSTQWTWLSERAALNAGEPAKDVASWMSSLKLDPEALFTRMLSSSHLSSREGVVRRFDHEVQGRTRKLPFGGLTEESPQDGSLIEITEDPKRETFVALGHGLAPWRRDIHDNVIHSLDESIRQGLLAGLRLGEAGFLDNFSWPDPLPSSSRPQSDRVLWKLLRTCELLSSATRAWGVPFVSGKDSMKNNSEGFDILETLVVSVASAASSPLSVPHGFFTRPNDVAFYLPPLRASLRDSALERTSGERFTSERHLLKGANVAELDEDLARVLEDLRLRYEQLSRAVSSGLVRSAKDISEGGLLTAAFEMCLGRSLGLQLEFEDFDAETFLAEGLGGFVLTCDVHRISDLEKALPGLKRLGVVMKPFVMRWGRATEWNLSPLRQAYRERSQQGFWS